jgi:hypothetical protein
VKSNGPPKLGKLSDIKRALIEAPVLNSANCSRDFHIFSFASENIVVGVLLQKNE